MTIIRPVRGSTANWMLHPPVSTPTSRMTAMATSRMFCAGEGERALSGDCTGPATGAAEGGSAATRVWLLVIASALTLVCAVVAGVAASAAGAELTRGPSAAELANASRAEMARRWQTWPLGRIFPEVLAYSAEQGGREQATRVGISSETRCEAAVDAALRPALHAAGCRAILRATYLDVLQGVVVTIGVGAFPDETAALRAKAAFPA